MKRAGEHTEEPNMVTSRAKKWSWILVKVRELNIDENCDRNSTMPRHSRERKETNSRERLCSKTSKRWEEGEGGNQVTLPEGLAIDFN